MIRLKELRKSMHLTQKEVSRMLNIHIMTYYKYETGKHEPNIEMLNKLADFFHTTVDYLIGRDTDNINLNAYSNTKAEIIKNVLNMSETEILRIKSYIDGINGK